MQQPVTSSTKEVMHDFFKFAHRAPINIAPERGTQLVEEIFESAKWTLAESEGEANFYAIPEEARIYLSYAGLASLWCVAYAAFHVVDISSRRQRDPRPTNATHIDIGDYGAAIRLGEYLAYARALCHADQPWPENLPIPSSQAIHDSPEGRINNVFLGALSWIMLHEIGHVHHQHERLIPSEQRIRNEFQADGFATQWVLDEAGHGLEREFRVLMISVGLSWLFLHYSAKGRGSNHPPAILRFREVANHFKMGERSVALENAFYVFKAFFDPISEPPTVETADEAFSWISDKLEKMFPA